jgi:hypothetical protein
VTTYQGYERDTRPRRRRRRWLGVLVTVLIVLAGLLVGADFAARAFAENEVASHIQQQGFPTRPSVTIDGFPFLTQAATRDFREVQMSAGSITEGPLQIQSMNATLDRVLVNSSYNGGTITQATGTADITFAALASAMTSQAGSALGSLISGALTLSAAGSNEVQASLGVAGIGVTAVWRVTVPTGHTISIQPVSGGSLLNGIGTITLKLPSLPLQLNLASINVTPAGLVATVTGRALASTAAARRLDRRARLANTEELRSGRARREAADHHRWRRHGTDDRVLRRTSGRGGDGAGEDARRRPCHGVVLAHPVGTE